LVTGLVAGGPVTITATSEGKSGTAAVTVVPIPVASVTVSPASPTITVGNTTQLTATTFDANGNTLSGRAIAWSSSNPAVASVSGNGLVTGLVAGGPVTITATSEGKNGTAAVTVAPPAGIITGIRNAVDFVSHCPTTDPAYNTIRQDFEFLRDGVPSTVVVTCTEPYTTVPLAQLTDELIAVQTLRLMYYMGQGTAGRLPWTGLGLYDWMKASVAGIDFRSQPGLSACCEVINGKRYIITSQKDAANRDFYRDWNALSGWAALFAHEARHATGPGHVHGCPAFPLPTDPLGCDATYDLSNLGSYGVQYWLFSGWATGFINVGIGCSPAATAQSLATWAASAANIYPTRFVTNAPPSVTATIPYGGPCLSP
jgi:hypothetical protein